MRISTATCKIAIREGGGVIGSVNYDFRFNQGNDGLGMRIGGKGLGNQTFPTGIDNLGYIGFAKAGIRVTPKNNGLFFNFNWNPMINTVETSWI